MSDGGVPSATAGRDVTIRFLAALIGDERIAAALEDQGLFTSSEEGRSDWSCDSSALLQSYSVIAALRAGGVDPTDPAVTVELLRLMLSWA